MHDRALVLQTDVQKADSQILIYEYSIYGTVLSWTTIINHVVSNNRRLRSPRQNLDLEFHGTVLSC